MSSTIENLAGQLESIPGYDYVLDKWNEYAGEKYATKNPYVEELPNGKTRKLKLPSNSTNQERKVWKKIQKKAWVHDKCFLGCYPVDCGIGLGPLLILVPGIGPLLMFAIHSRLITLADHNFDMDASTTAKCHANIIFDFLISLPPVIGSLFSWMNGCSSRNAALIHTRICKVLTKRHERENRASVQMNHQNNANSNGTGNSNYYKSTSDNNSGRHKGKDKNELQQKYTNGSDPFKSPPQSPNVPKPPNKQAYYSRRGNIVDQQGSGTYNANMQQARNLPPPVVPPRDDITYQRGTTPTPPYSQQPALPPRVYQSNFNVQ